MKWQRKNRTIVISQSQTIKLFKKHIDSHTIHSVKKSFVFQIQPQVNFKHLFWKILHHKLRDSKEAFLSAYFSAYSGSLFLLLRLTFPPPCTSGQLLCWEDVIWAKRGGKVSRPKIDILRPLCLWWNFSKNKPRRQYVHWEIQLFRSNHSYGAYSL